MKMSKKLLSLVLAATMTLGMGAAAFAADGDGVTPSPIATSKMVKELTVAEGVVPPTDFTFSFTAVKSDTASVADHPEIGVKTITVAQDDTTKTLYKGEIALSDLFTIDSFPHAGEYVYTVKETTEGYENKTEGDVKKTLVVDDTEYTVRVYVKNGEEGLEFAGVTVAKPKAEGEGEDKVDPTNDGFKFSNKYEEEIVPADDGAVLTVTKTISGAYADKTKTFPITVELTIPEVNDAATAVELAADSKGTLNGTTVSAELTNDESIKFSKLPAGTTFVVKETQDSLYKSKTTGYVKVKDTAYVAGDVNKVGEGPVTKAGNEVTIENNREDVIPTGILINNLPYFLLVVFAFAGVAYMQMKKRRV